MNLSVVVCAKNAVNALDQCLESIRRNNPSEIIIVDGNSTDKTVETALLYTDKVYSDEGKGLAYARQMGAEKASSEYIAYVDSDVVLPENCLRTMVSELESKGYVAIHAQIVALKCSNYWEWAEDQHFKISFNREGKRRAIGTIAAVFQRNKVMEYKFDLFFSGAAEDGDLCYRLRKDGYVLGVSSAFAYHLHRADARSFVRQRRWYGKGNARFFWKHRAFTTLLGASLMAPFGIIICIERRSPKMLPYYLVWSLAGTYGTLSEMASLTFRRLMSDVPK